MPASAQTPAPAGVPPLALGTQTHFSHGWRLPWMDRARSLGASRLRDGLGWAAIETRPGVYDFDPYHVDFLEKARRDGIGLLLCIDPRHPAYDDGHTAFSETARTAFAAYLDALLDRYGDVVKAIEVGNEINSQDGMSGDAGGRRAQAHVALLTTIHRQVKPSHPDVAILGGSTNVIGTGFLEHIFAAGGLEVMDGVAVHPYRDQAEHVDVELAHLTRAMSRHGRIVPIHATEFGSEVDRPEEASPLMLKMVAMLGASGVEQAFWYALSDEAAFRNMGLFTQRQALKPAGETFRFIQQQLLKGGRPRRVTSDDLSHVYRFGSAGSVIWGVDRPIRLHGDARAFDARGRPLPAPARLTEAPVVLLGDIRIDLGPCDIVADSFHQFATAPWSYFAQTPNGVLHPLDWVHWDWTSYIGDRVFQPLQFNPRSLAPAGTGRDPVVAVLRYTAPVAGRFALQARLSHAGERGDGVTATLSADHVVLETAVVSGEDFAVDRTITLEAGQTVDLAVGPNVTFGGDSVRYHVVLRRIAP